MNERCYVLTLSCPDRVGIVAAVGSLIASHHGWIVEASHHSAPSNWFFMRHLVRADSLPFGVDEFRQRFAHIAGEFHMTWSIVDTAVRKRVVILVSKKDHCLADLLYRWRTNELAFDVPCIVSNHEDLRPLVEWHGIPYIHVPISSSNREAAFRHIDELCTSHGADVVVLARFMQVVPQAMCEKYSGKIINIHHSFLPSFVGSRPYHHAWERGVKLIGATCHYVTAELDAGPIIEQDVVRVDHADSVEDMVRLGRDVEKAVLARGLQYHLEDRVLVHDHRTIVFT